MKKPTLLTSLLAVLAIAGCNESIPYGACTGKMAILDNGQLKVCVDHSWSEDTTCTEDGATMCGNGFVAKCTEQKWQVSTECASFEVCKDDSGTATCVESTTCDTTKDVPVCDGQDVLKTCVDGKWTSTDCGQTKICTSADANNPVASCVETQPPAGCDTPDTTCDNGTFRYCENNEWKTKTCTEGCEGTICKEDVVVDDICNNPEEYPKCDGDKLLTCEGGHIVTTPCDSGKCSTNESGASCESSNPDIKECTESCDYGCNTNTGSCYVECNPTEHASSCSENTLTYCDENGEIKTQGCGEDVCKDDGNGAQCVPDDVPPVTENDCTEEGKSICDGNSLKTCEGGEWEVRPCVEGCKEDEPGNANCSELEVGTECQEGDAQCDGTFKIIKCENGFWTESMDCGYQQTCQKIDDVSQCSNACKKGRGICNPALNATYICNDDTLTWEMTPCDGKRCAVSEKKAKCIINAGEACELYSFNKDDDPIEQALCDFDRMFVCKEDEGKLADKQPFCGSGKDEKSIKLCADDIPIYRPCYEYAWIGTSCNIGNLSQVMTKQNFNDKSSEALSRASDDEINDPIYLAAKEALTENSSCEINECKLHYFTINADNCTETIEGEEDKGCHTYQYNASDHSATKSETYYLQNSELKFIAGPIVQATTSEGTIDLRAIYNIDSKEIVYSWIKAEALSEQNCGQVVKVED